MKLVAIQEEARMKEADTTRYRKIKIGKIKCVSRD